MRFQRELLERSERGRKESEEPRGRGTNEGKKEKEDEEEDAEAVKDPKSLQKLAGVREEADPSIRFGDWVTKISLTISGMSKTSKAWWDEVVKDTGRMYRVWMSSGPLERVRMEIETKEEARKHEMLTAKVADLLLDALPKEVGEQLISTRKTCVRQILFYVMTLYQPGGVTERAQVVKQLEDLGVCESATQCLKALELWERRKCRAEALGATLPDLTIMIRTVSNAVVPIFKKEDTVALRVGIMRASLEVDTVPTTRGLEQFIQLCIAELNQLALVEQQSQRPDEAKQGPKDSEGTVALKRLGHQDGPMRGEPGKGGGKGGKPLKMCWSFGEKEGCQYGGLCHFYHERPPQGTDKCWNCGAEGHDSRGCTRPKREAGGKGQGKTRGVADELDKRSERGEDSDGKSWSKGQEKSWERDSPNAKASLPEASEGKKKGEREEKEKEERESEKTSELVKVLRSLARMKRINTVEDKPSNEEKVILARLKGSAGRGCLDSGTNVSVRQMNDKEKNLDRRGKLKERDAELATGEKVRVKENERGTVVTAEAVQPLLPYVRALERLRLKQREDEETGKLWIEHPTRGRLEVYTESGTMEMDEDIILQLIEELEEKLDQGDAKGKEEGDSAEMEVEKLMRKMMDRGWTIEELAERVGEQFGKSAVKDEEEKETEPDCADKLILRSIGEGRHDTGEAKEEFEEEPAKWRETGHQDGKMKEVQGKERNNNANEETRDKEEPQEATDDEWHCRKVEQQKRKKEKEARNKEAKEKKSFGKDQEVKEGGNEHEEEEMRKVCTHEAESEDRWTRKKGLSHLLPPWQNELRKDTRKDK